MICDGFNALLKNVKPTIRTESERIHITYTMEGTSHHNCCYSSTAQQHTTRRAIIDIKRSKGRDEVKRAERGREKVERNGSTSPMVSALQCFHV